MNKSVHIRKYVFNIQLSKLFSLEKKKVERIGHLLVLKDVIHNFNKVKHFKSNVWLLLMDV